MTERRPPAKENTDAGFWSRWSEQKQAAKQADEAATPPKTESPPEPKPRALTDADMPPIDSLDASSDFAGFLSPEVSEGLRRLALRKLFHSADFNVCDGLDDYAEDFTAFEKLGDVITSDMRYRIEQEARRAASEEPAGRANEADPEVRKPGPEDPSELTAEADPLPEPVQSENDTRRPDGEPEDCELKGQAT